MVGRLSFPFGRKCNNCVMFRAPGSCTLVAGKIRRLDVCDRWEAKRDG